MLTSQATSSSLEVARASCQALWLAALACFEVHPVQKPGVLLQANIFVVDVDVAAQKSLQLCKQHKVRFQQHIKHSKQAAKAAEEKENRQQRQRKRNSPDMMRIPCSGTAADSRVAEERGFLQQMGSRGVEVFMRIKRFCWFGGVVKNFSGGGDFCVRLFR